ncbi:MAG: ABC transporter substrate-binding protein [Deltaproteobacteria bacterium]|nr:ABC transporter substrate-binding protein [Deltaproteobacteria bacterium]
MKRRTIAVIGVFFLAAIFLTSVFAPPASAREIKIGVLIPLSGYISFFGKMQDTALQIAKKEFKQMGPAGGFDLNFILYDTGSKPKDAILMAQKLIHTDKVACIIGPFLSTVCEQVFPVVNRAKVPIITASSAKPGITKANRPWTFRNIMTSDKINEPTIKAWIEAHNIKTVAILTDIKSKVSEIYGKNVAPALLKKHGVKIVESIDFVTEDVDFSAQITKVKGINPDGIVLAGEYHLAANIAREARKQGLKQPFIGDVPITSDGYCKLGGSAVEGTYAATDFWTGNPDPKVVSFLKKFHEIYPKDKLPHTTTAAMYDTLHVTRTLVEKMGLSGAPGDLRKDREKIKEGWAGLKDYPGLSKTRIDENGEAWKEYYTLVVKNGRWVRIN